MCCPRFCPTEWGSINTQGKWPPRRKFIWTTSPWRYPVAPLETESHCRTMEDQDPRRENWILHAYNAEIQDTTLRRLYAKKRTSISKMKPKNEMGQEIQLRLQVMTKQARTHHRKRLPHRCQCKDWKWIAWIMHHTPWCYWTTQSRTRQQLQITVVAGHLQSVLATRTSSSRWMVISIKTRY